MAARLLLAGYRALPEWLVRNLVYLVLLIAFAIAFALLFLRPYLRMLRIRLNRLRH